MAKRRVVNTGAAGYVGQRMCKELAERWDGVSIDVFATGKVDGKKLEVVQWRIDGPRDDDIEHVKPGDIKVMHRALGAYLSRRDQVQQAIRMVETPDIEDENGVPFLIVYGISGNTHRFWSLASAKTKIGYEPQDDSQVNFADAIAAIARKAPKT